MSELDTNVKRILFVGEHLTQSHIMRPWMLARACKDALPDLEVHFAAPTVPTRAKLNSDIHTHTLNSPPTSVLQKRLDRALLPLYTTTDIYEMVKSDAEVLSNVQPDLVVHDFRNTLALSMHNTCVPRIALLDFYWGAQYVPEPTVPDNPLTTLFGQRLSYTLACHLEPKIEQLHIAPFNKIAGAKGMPSFTTLRHLYTNASALWYMDTPTILPFKLQPDETSIGPVLWETEAEDPKWLSSLTDREAICITFGTNGNPRNIQTIIAALKPLKKPIVVLTANRIDIPSEPGVYSAPFVTFSKILKKSCLLICHGGSSLVYPALKEKVPVIGIPSNIAQWYSMRQFAEKKLGILLPQYECTRERILNALHTISTNSSYQKNILEIQQEIFTYDPIADFTKNLQLTYSRFSPMLKGK